MNLTKSTTNHSPVPALWVGKKRADLRTERLINRKERSFQQVHEWVLAVAIHAQVSLCGCLSNEWDDDGA